MGLLVGSCVSQLICLNQDSKASLVAQQTTGRWVIASSRRHLANATYSCRILGHLPPLSSGYSMRIEPCSTASFLVLGSLHKTYTSRQ